MDCTDVKALLSAIIDGGLPADDRHGAERHLAECADCRSLVSEAERADALVAAAITADGPADELPDGFEGAVLARTVYEHDRRAADRWRSWLGWLAAAASIVLAVVLWPMGRTPVADPDASSRVVTTIYPPAPELRSWSLQEPLANVQPRARLAVVNEIPRYEGDAPGGSWEMTTVARQATADAVARVATDNLSRDTAETIESVAMVLSILENADDRNFADVEQARQITEYEQLLPRLAEIRGELPPADRPVIMAAESMLYRVVRGPMNLDDVRELRNTIARLDLPDQIDALTGGRVRSSSL